MVDLKSIWSAQRGDFIRHQDWNSFGIPYEPENFSEFKIIAECSEGHFIAKARETGSEVCDLYKVHVRSPSIVRRTNGSFLLIL